MLPLSTEVPATQVCVLKAGASKHDALEALIDAIATNGAIGDREAFADAVYAREDVMSTGIGGGIAIPHVRLGSVSKLTIAVAVAPKGIDYGALDNQPVHVLVLFATPEGADKDYLGLLAKVMLALRDKAFYGRLVACRGAAEAHRVLNGA